jgi:hypothetical protein
MKRPARCLRARMWCRNIACDVTHVLYHMFSATRLLSHDRLTITEIYLNFSPKNEQHAAAWPYGREQDSAMNFC